MTTPIARPPRLASWLIGRRVPRAEREFVLGDLDEEFDEIAQTARGVRGARRWYWRQTLRCLVSRQPRSSVPLRPKGASMSVLQDFRFALRLLRRMPAFTATAILTLALGTGATTAIFSVVHAVLLGPLPFANGERLVVARDGANATEATPISYQEFLDWRDAGVFQETAAYFNWSGTLTGEGDAEQLQGLRVSASLFSALGARPLIGGLFTRADEARGAEPKLLIGERLWRGRFGGAADIVGRRLVLSGQTFTVVGVLPASFRMRPSDPAEDLVAPLRLTDQVAPPSLHFMIAVGLLKPGQTASQARDALQALARRLHPEAQPAVTVTIASVREVVTGDSRPVLLSLLGAVGFLLLITCANLANLLLARASGRRQEMAVRLAIGAARGRLVRQLLTESLVLALAGGLAGVILAWIGVSIAGDAAAVRAAGAYDVRVNVAVLGFALAVSMAAGLLFGLAPAFDAGRQSLRAQSGDATRASSSRPRLRGALVVAEMASTLVLLVGAVLLIRSFSNLLTVDKGFDPDRVLSFSLDTPPARYPTPAVQTQFFQAALEGLTRLPGVTAAGLASELPLGGSGTNGGVPIEGMTFAPGQLPAPEKRIVSPDFFAALRIRVIAGRTFAVRDTATAPAVMVVSESFSRRYFGTSDGAIGHRAGFNWDMDGKQEIVGVVADVKHYGLDDRPLPMVYVSYLQRPIDYAGLVVRTTGDPLALVADARNVVRALDKDNPLIDVDTMDGVVSRSVGTRRFALWLVSGFAALALVLAATGLYGVVSYIAQQRTREFGIRVALGARSDDVVRLVLRQGLIPAAVGLLTGIAGALALMRLIRNQLFGVEPSDPSTFALVGVTLVVVALAACAMPAWRATRINPATVLRGD